MKDLKRLRPDDSVDESKELELCSLGLPSSHVSHTNATRADGEVSTAERDVETGGPGAGVMGGGWRGHGAAKEDVEDNGSDEDEDAPFTYAQLQERTQAARAAVNILLPNRTDDMAGRDGPYGLRRRQRGGR